MQILYTDFSYADGSKKAKRAKGTEWEDTMFQMKIGVRDEGLEVINNPRASSNDLQEHLASVISQTKDETLKSIYELAMQKNEDNLKKRKIMRQINGSQSLPARSFEEPEYLSNTSWP